MAEVESRVYELGGERRLPNRAEKWGYTSHRSSPGISRATCLPNFLDCRLKLMRSDTTINSRPLLY